jgi:hypothetical protein
MTDPCIHHWIIPEGKAAKLSGTCSLCGATREFMNQIIHENAYEWLTAQMYIAKATKEYNALPENQWMFLMSKEIER